MAPDDSKKRVGDYELLEVLGTGAQGQVYKARCLVSGKPDVPEGDLVAIKLLSRGSGDPEDDNRFKRQADVLERLDHPSICRYIDYFIESEGEIDEVRGLVMEFLDGESLTDRLKRYPRGLPFEEVKRIFEQCLDGLVHAAERGIIHRDLKPSNIYLTRDGHAKLIDFGIARQEDSEDASTAGWKGSFDYMSPDFVTQKEFHGDEQSDIFSLGICFVMALTGQLPYPSFGENAHIGYIDRWQKDEEPRPSFRHKSYRVLTKVKPFILSSLSKDRSERYTTFREMLEGLQEIKFRLVRHRGKDDYELIDVLGRGGFGEVYKGRRVSDGKLVAIKHLFAGRQESRFIKEAKLLQKYVHPDIVEYYDFIEVEGLGDDKEYFLIMEYLPGMPGAGLNSRVRRSSQGIDPTEVVEMFIHFLSALMYLHESPRPIIHRDIKPGNLYAPPGQPQKAKLFDLGVARDVSGTLTTGMIPGTLDYMAPEFAKPGSDRGTPQSDLYAMGVSLYEALTGDKPFPRLPKADQEAFVQFVSRAQNPPAVDYSHPVFAEWPRLKQIVQRALESNPKRRYPRTRDMMQDLEVLLQQAMGEMDVDPDDVPTRATIADPELLERIKAHQQERNVKIPTEEMEHISESESAPDVEERPDWMEEESDSYEPESPRPSSTAAPPTYAAPAPPPAKTSPLVKIAAVLVIVAVLGLGGYFLADKLQNPRDLFIKEVKELASPVVEEAYVRRLMSMRARAKEMKLEDPDYAVWWDNQVAELSDLGEAMPELFEEGFAAAVRDADLARAQRLQSTWENLGDAASFMGVSERDFISRLDAMRGEIDRFEFLTAVADAKAEVPDEVTGPEQVAAAEAAAKTLADLRGRSWDAVPDAERNAAFVEIEQPLVFAARGYIERQQKAAVDAYGEGTDASAIAQAVRELPATAPAWTALVEQDHAEAVAALDSARAEYERMQRVASTVQRLRDAVPEQIGSPDDLAAAEQAMMELKQEAALAWDGISEEDKAKALGRIRDDIAAKAGDYIAGLEAAAVAGYEAKEESPPAAEALQSAGLKAPSVIDLVNGRYAQAVEHVREAESALEQQLIAEAEAAERARLEQERAQRELAARQEQERLEAERRQQVAAFQAEVERIQGLLPDSISSAGDAARAEQAADAIAAFRAASWPGAEPGRQEALADEFGQALDRLASDYIAGLRERAITRVEGMENEIAEWDDLKALRDEAPDLVDRVRGAYEGAVLDVEVAFRKRAGINEFTDALDRLRGQIPASLSGPAELAEAEAAAVAYQDALKQEWEVVSEAERTEALDRIGTALRRQAAGYLDRLKTDALAKYGALREAPAETAALEGMQDAAPTLTALLGDRYRDTLDEVATAREAMEKSRAFTEALAGIDRSLPSSAETAAQLSQLQAAASAYAEVADASWPNIDPDEVASALAERRNALETLTGERIERLREEAVRRYRNREDGDAARQALAELADTAPAAVELVQSAYDDAVAAIEQVRTGYEQYAKFARAVEAIENAAPGSISSDSDLAQAEKAATALAKVQDASWEQIPDTERTDALSRIRRALVDAGRQYVDTVKDAATTKYQALEDADAERDRLQAMKDQAPTLIALLERPYLAAIQSVETARAQKENRVREIEAEKKQAEAERLAELKRQEELRKEQERLAQLREKEEGGIQQVRDAWAAVQAAWEAGEDTGLQDEYQAILGKSFEFDEFEAEYTRLRDGFLSGLKARIGGAVNKAEQEIAGYRTFLYQVSDPSFGGSYRLYREETPVVSISLPPMADLADVDLGFSRAELLRLEAWSQSGQSLSDGGQVRSLAETLGKLAVAARQQKLFEVATRCEMESLLLVSEPAVFPASLEEAVEPLEIFRWRAHAMYQPETTALDVLRDLRKYVDQEGDINEFDVRLTLFAAYYSWRNAIEGENEYAQRVRDAVAAVAARAGENIAAGAIDFLDLYIQEGGDDDTEFPGLYLMHALTMINADSPLKADAATWLKENGATYAARVRTIEPQLGLLRKLLN